MANIESDLVKRIIVAPINYALLKLIHHEVGNGLAVLSGYRHLLQKAISAQAQEPFPPTQEVWQDRYERVSGYLRIMQAREICLNNLLAQLRKLSSEATDEPLCQRFVQTDLAALLVRVIEQRTLLCPNCVLQVRMPAQPLFIMCDPFWIQVLFEHIFFNHIAECKDTVSTKIYLEPIQNSMGREAKVTSCFVHGPPKLTPEKEKEFEALVQQLEQEEVEACLALNHKILHEHGGQLWSEKEGSISLALPLTEENKERV